MLKNRVKKYTLRQCLEKYLNYQENVKKVKTHTILRNRSECRILAAIFEPEGYNAFPYPKDYHIYYIEEKISGTGKPIKTQNHYLQSLKTILKFAYQKEIISTPIHQKITYLPETAIYKKIEDKYLEQIELRRLIKYFREQNILHSTKIAIIIEFMAQTGLRYGEMQALTFSDIDFKKQIISVEKTYNEISKISGTPKTRSSKRKIACNIRTLMLVKEYQSITGKYDKRDNIFININGVPMRNQGFNRKLLKAARVLGINKTLTSHTLRHTHTSLLFQQGLSLDIIARRLGHESEDITRRIYLHITKKLQEHDFRIFRKMDIL